MKAERSSREHAAPRAFELEIRLARIRVHRRVAAILIGFDRPPKRHASGGLQIVGDLLLGRKPDEVADESAVNARRRERARRTVGHSPRTALHRILRWNRRKLAPNQTVASRSGATIGGDLSGSEVRL